MKGRAKPTPCDTSECGREKKDFAMGLTYIYRLSAQVRMLSAVQN